MDYLTVYNPNKDILDILSQYGIEHNSNRVKIDLKLVNQWVSENNIIIFEKLRRYVGDNDWYTILRSIYGIGSSEFIKQIIHLDLFRHTCRYYSIVFDEISSREDDNVEILHVMCEYLNFSKLFITFQKFEIEKSCHDSRLFSILKNAINNGNYRIFEYTVTTFGLKREYFITCKLLKELILTTLVFSPKIFDLMIKDFIDIEPDDIESMVQNNKLPQLEHIVHLIENRIIELDQKEMEYLKEYIGKQSLVIKELFSVIC
jgi:hypothetical protein